MPTFIFDLDDTIYNQIDPFQQSIEKNFDFEGIAIEQLYIAFRKHSDELFYLEINGQMSMADMHIARIQKALEEFDISISREEAEQFQKDYQYFQYHIEVTSDMKQTLDYCVEKGIRIGIITNGPLEHQRSKLKQLEIEKWIPAENIFISSEVEIAKPDIRLFELVEEKMNVVKENMYYIGDSYPNDIIASKEAGWKAIWINRRGIQPEVVKHDYVVDKNSTLFSVISKIV